MENILIGKKTFNKRALLGSVVQGRLRSFSIIWSLDRALGGLSLFILGYLRILPAYFLDGIV